MNRFLSVFVTRVIVGYLLAFFLYSPVVEAQLSQTSLKNTSGQNTSTSGKGVGSLDGKQDSTGGQNQGFQFEPQSMGSTPFSLQQNKISVHILGDVYNPGVYKVPVSERAFDAAKLARPKRANFRILQVRHPGRKTRVYDLYQYFYFGNLAQNPYLKDNDVIFIPKQRGAVKIEGPVSRPGIYELSQEKNLAQIVKLSGGFTRAMSKMQPLKVIRFADGGKKFILNVVQTKSALKNFKIKAGDIVIVPDVINANSTFDYAVESIPGENLVYPTAIPDVFVIGTVRQPGPYPYKSHLTVKDYLGYAGASEEANLRSVIILRDGKKRRKNLYAKVQQGDVIIVKQKSMNQFFKYLGIAATLMSFTLSVIVFKDTLGNQ